MRIYITDALKCISENTAITEGSSHMAKRWIEQISRKVAPVQQDDLSGDEMADRFMERIGV